MISNLKMATKWGIVSAGKISHDFACVLRSLSPLEHKIIAVAARKLEDAQKFAEQHEIPKAFGSYAELATNPDVDVVYVGTVTSHHFPVGRLMLEAGKHVLMEKPMCMNVKETKELIKLAKEKQLFLMEALWSRFLPTYRKLMSELAKQTIGDVYYINSTSGMNSEAVARINKKELGGGVTLDLGIYTLNSVLMVYGSEKPLQIEAVGHLNSDGVDENVAAVLKFSKGRLATISYTSKAQLPCELEVVGTKGTLKLPFPMWCGNILITPDTKYDFLLPPTVGVCNFINSSGLRYEADCVRECLQKGLLECPKMSHADSELLATLMEEIRKQLGVTYPSDAE
ncbi:trans-1,2-dihydrobenzene-1,2-diol dehydrogenase-like isoform X2 [Tachypleus tridentatus]|uniref:trans-1,2-dihydrobenzene-1,2-diol dehydrogenase-like isoform X2 n=1 Tax=Tachypleus tridentatus TaxID=6853 RepID=UPI003FD22CE4